MEGRCDPRIRIRVSIDLRAFSPFDPPETGSWPGIDGGHDPACLSCGGALTDPRACGKRCFDKTGFPWPSLRPGPCRPIPLSYMRHAVAISRAFDLKGVLDRGAVRARPTCRKKKDIGPWERSSGSISVPPI